MVFNSFLRSFTFLCFCASFWTSWNNLTCLLRYRFYRNIIVLALYCIFYMGKDVLCHVRNSSSCGGKIYLDLIRMILFFMQMSQEKQDLDLFSLFTYICVYIDQIYNSFLSGPCIQKHVNITYVIKNPRTHTTQDSEIMYGTEKDCH